MAKQTRQQYIDELKAEIAKCEQQTDSNWARSYARRTFLAFAVEHFEEYDMHDDIRLGYVGEFDNKKDAFNACKNDLDKNANYCRITPIYNGQLKDHIIRNRGQINL